MPEPLIHIVVTLLILLMFGVRLKTALPISLLAISPDFDVLFSIHRSMSHSVILIFAFFAPLIVLSDRLMNHRLKEVFIISMLVILAHPFIDMFTDYTPILWPLLDRSVYMITQMTVNIADLHDINLKLCILSKPVDFTIEDVDAPIFSSPGVGVSLVFFAGILIKYINSIKRKKT